MSEDDDQKSSKSFGTKQAVLVVTAYLIPLVAVFFDEVVFRTFLIWNVMPSWLLAVFKVVYFPIKFIFQFLKFLRH